MSKSTLLPVYWKVIGVCNLAKKSAKFTKKFSFWLTFLGFPLKERVRRANKLTCQIGLPIQETIINQCANEPL